MWSSCRQLKCYCEGGSLCSSLFVKGEILSEDFTNLQRGKERAKSKAECFRSTRRFEIEDVEERGTLIV